MCGRELVLPKREEVRDGEKRKQGRRGGGGTWRSKSEGEQIRKGPGGSEREDRGRSVRLLGRVGLDVDAGVGRLARLGGSGLHLGDSVGVLEEDHVRALVKSHEKTKVSLDEEGN